MKKYILSSILSLVILTLSSQALAADLIQVYQKSVSHLSEKVSPLKVAQFYFATLEANDKLQLALTIKNFDQQIVSLQKARYQVGLAKIADLKSAQADLAEDAKIEAHACQNLTARRKALTNLTQTNYQVLLAINPSASLSILGVKADQLSVCQQVKPNRDLITATQDLIRAYNAGDSSGKYSKIDIINVEKNLNIQVYTYLKSLNDCLLAVMQQKQQSGPLTTNDLEVINGLLTKEVKLLICNKQ